MREKVDQQRRGIKGADKKKGSSKGRRVGWIAHQSSAIMKFTITAEEEERW